MNMINVKNSDWLVVNETEKAIEAQIWFSSGSNPDKNARCYWIPKSCCTLSNDHKQVITVAAWFVRQKGLYNHI